MNYYNLDFSSEENQRKLVEESEQRFKLSLQRVADMAAGQSSLKFIALSGPTCSGKTTTAGFLTSKLELLGKNVKIISIDDFFLDKEIIHERARRDGRHVEMDSVNAIDLDELKNVVRCIEELKPAKLPIFDFTVGRRRGYTEYLPKANDIFIFEGIQAVYPEVTELFNSKHLLKIYISVEQGIDFFYGSLDSKDIRLVRRIVRDARTRGTDADSTIGYWNNVTLNEEKNIEPYKETCDIRIDSGLKYEICVLKAPLMACLEKINSQSPNYLKAKMLLEKITDFPDMSSKYVPADSVLREFIG